MKLVKMYRPFPTHPGGPVTQEVPFGSVELCRQDGWLVGEPGPEMKRMASRSKPGGYSVGIYGNGGNSYLDAIFAGCKESGLQPMFLDYSPSIIESLDIVVLHGFRHTSPELFRKYRERNIPVFVFDAGHICRDLGYHQLGLNGLSGHPPQAPHDRAKELGLIVKPKRRKGKNKHVLICEQKSGDAQHKYPDFNVWTEQAVQKLEAVTIREIIRRPHPKYANPGVGWDEMPRTLGDQLKDAHCMVTHNSTAAYEAIIMGIPVLCDDVAVYAGVVETDWGNLEDPRFGSIPQRQALIDRVAYGQWLLSEFEQGLPFKFWIHEIGYDKMREL